MDSDGLVCARYRTVLGGLCGADGGWKMGNEYMKSQFCHSVVFEGNQPAVSLNTDLPNKPLTTKYTSENLL